jgi:hypothetical protein
VRSENECYIHGLGHLTSQSPDFNPATIIRLT